MTREITDQFEIGLQSCVWQHTQCVAADRDDLSARKRLMGVEVEDILVMRNFEGTWTLRLRNSPKRLEFGQNGSLLD